MANLERDIVLIKEQCETELQILINVAFISLQPLDQVRARAKKIIDKYTKQVLRKGKTYTELAKKLKKGFIQSFNRWCLKLINQLAKSINKGEKVYYIAYILLKGKVPDKKRLADALDEIKTLYEKKEISPKNEKSGDKEETKQVDQKQETTRKGGTFDIDATNIKYKLETPDSLRQFITSGESAYSQMFIDQYTDRVKQTMNEIVQNGATIVEKESASGVIVDRPGKKAFSLRNLAELEVRYQERNKTLGSLVDQEIKYCVCSQHNNPSVRCQNLQGLIYKIDCDENFTEKKPILLKGRHLKPIGTIDGKPYYSLKEAISHGLLGYNCRHRLVEYKKGMNIPKPIPPKEIEKERSIELTQREMERKIRYCKKKQMIATTAKERKHWQQQSKLWYQKYVAFCKQHEIVIETWRCSITENEREYV